MRKNQIADLHELKYLSGLPNLKVLWLWDNPIAQHPVYRQFIIKSLPNLVKLDNTPISMERLIEHLSDIPTRKVNFVSEQEPQEL